jgi:hypothetical protein
MILSSLFHVNSRAVGSAKAEGPCSNGSAERLMGGPQEMAIHKNTSFLHMSFWSEDGQGFRPAVTQVMSARIKLEPGGQRLHFCSVSR